MAQGLEDWGDLGFLRLWKEGEPQEPGQGTCVAHKMPKGVYSTLCKRPKTGPVPAAPPLWVCPLLSIPAHTLVDLWAGLP